MQAQQITTRATRNVAAAAARPRRPAAAARPSTTGPSRRARSSVGAPAFAPPREAMESYHYAADILCEVSYTDDDMLSAADARVASAYPNIFSTEDVPCRLTYSEDETD